MRRLTVAICLVGALLGLGATTVVAGQQRASKPAWSHVVQRGETLWGLAKSASPGRDSRETVDRLVRANHLRGGAIFPGQRLVLPAL
jgi:LysM repeat protein